MKRAPSRLFHQQKTRAGPCTTYGCSHKRELWSAILTKKVLPKRCQLLSERQFCSNGGQHLPYIGTDTSGLAKEKQHIVRIAVPTVEDNVALINKMRWHAQEHIHNLMGYKGKGLDAHHRYGTLHTALNTHRAAHHTPGCWHVYMLQHHPLLNI